MVPNSAAGGQKNPDMPSAETPRAETPAVETAVVETPGAAATRAQRQASDPTASVWVGASAGTGKTKVLTDRVLALLLKPTRPEKLLCLTFTKAAAAEMQNRIAQKLAVWSTSTDEALRGELDALLGRIPEPHDLLRARQLFATVLDTPGGMRIETVHAFCQSILRRFPLEAGIAPHFEVMDDRKATETLRSVVQSVLTEVLESPASPVAVALSSFAAKIDEGTFDSLLLDALSERGKFQRLFQRAADDPEWLESAFRRALCLEADEERNAVLANACRDEAFDLTGLKDAASVLLNSSAKTDRGRGEKIASWLSLDQPRRIEDFVDSYCSAFFTQTGTIAVKLCTNKIADKNPMVPAILLSEAERLEAVQNKLRALEILADSLAFSQIVKSVLQRYTNQKNILARMDYDDLILATVQLLTGQHSSSGQDAPSMASAAAWVLFKLDGGIEHILVDEAQDTNPDQWRIIQAIAEEFFAGDGAYGSGAPVSGGTETASDPRTVFVVGDAKQSIYSFQRADPTAFANMRSFFSQHVEAASQEWRPVSLNVSFRSTEAVLTVVDAVFGQQNAAVGVALDSEAIQHSAFREGQAGRVEIWPVAMPGPQEEERPWELPLVEVSQQQAPSPVDRLIGAIVGQIADWLKRGEELPSRGRPIRPGDIMILLQKRGRLMDPLVKALKQAQIAVAGVDRMKITDQLAVMDLMAVADFLLLPNDDLTLATVLKTPLLGWDDDQLFDLAYGRGRTSLWRTLVKRRAENATFARAHSYLADMLGDVDVLPPFELFSKILTHRGGFDRLVGRLGAEAEDPINEFLNLMLDHARTNPPSLQSFMHWLTASETTIKRELDQGTANEVRILTVHGSKGLQAPIVFLPDAPAVPTQGVRNALLWAEDDSAGSRLGQEPVFLPLRSPGKAADDPFAAGVRDTLQKRQDDEYRRLLYVAMTRAEDRLIVCGAAQRSNQKEINENSWYSLISSGMKTLQSAEEFDFIEEHRWVAAQDGGEDSTWLGTAMRLETQQTETAEKRSQEQRDSIQPVDALPIWATTEPDPEPVPTKPLIPSRPEVPEPAMRSPFDGTDTTRFQRGLLIHRLLQTLPDLSESRWESAAHRFLARPTHDLPVALQNEIAAETLGVLRSSILPGLFGPGSRAEVPLIGHIRRADGSLHVVSGQVDRLVVTETTVLIADFKTNRPAPQDVDGVPAAYLEQMSTYRELLRAIYPNHDIQTALIWTDPPARAMILPPQRLDEFT